MSAVSIAGSILFGIGTDKVDDWAGESFEFDADLGGLGGQVSISDRTIVVGLAKSVGYSAGFQLNETEVIISDEEFKEWAKSFILWSLKEQKFDFEFKFPNHEKEIPEGQVIIEDIEFYKGP